jgi:hypothetical protein
LTSPYAPFISTGWIPTIAFNYQSASIYSRFHQMAVCFTKMAKLEQQEQLGKENDKLWFFT